MSNKRRNHFAAAIFAALMLGSGAAQAAPAAPSGQKLLSFGDGDVTLTGPTSATIVNDSGEYGGVYVNSKSASGKLLAKVSFQFRNGGGDSAGGAPRFSLPIDTDMNGTVDGYAFMDVNGCGGTSGDNTLVSTESTTCHVFFNGVDYANWATFAGDNPTYRMAPGSIPFIIADWVGSYSVTDIELR